MKFLKKDHVFLISARKLFDLLAKLSLVYTVFISFEKSFDSDIKLSIFQYVLIIIAIAITFYYIASIGQLNYEYLTLKKRYKRTFLHKNIEIGYEVGSFWDVVDRFKKEENVAVVVGVNDRLILDENFLNKSSLINQYFEKTSKEHRVSTYEDILEKMKDEVIDHDDKGNPIFKNGAVYVAHPTGEIFYELAMLVMCTPLEVKVAGRFNSAEEQLIEAIDKLFGELPPIFTDATLVIPLIGTKSSGAPLTHNEVAKLIISTFAHYSRIKKQRIAKKLIVSLYDGDYQNFNDLMDVKKHIDIECDLDNFSYGKMKHKIEG